MISNATRVFCAMLSTMGAAGLVAFANPASALNTPHNAAPTTVVAAATPAGAVARG